MNSINNRILVLIICHLGLVMVLTNCTNFDDRSNTEFEEGSLYTSTESWICDLESMEEDDYRYEFYTNDNGDYLAMSFSKMIKVNKDGNVQSVHIFNFQDDDIYYVRRFQDKLYRFHYESFTYDETKPMKLQIYDLDLNLLSEHVLDTYGTYSDVQFISQEVFVILINNPTDQIMTLKKISVTDGLLDEIVLSTEFINHPWNITMLENGGFICYGRNTFFVDASFNLISEFNFEGEWGISDAIHVPNKGVYITGGYKSPELNNGSFVALTDVNGQLLDSYIYDAEGFWNNPEMEINSDRICLIQLESAGTESGRDIMMTMLDYDLNELNILDIPGGSVSSNIIVNEFDSFSFVFGRIIDPTDTGWDAPRKTRIFKFDESFEVPTNIILQ